MFQRVLRTPWLGPGTRGALAIGGVEEPAAVDAVAFSDVDEGADADADTDAGEDNGACAGADAGGDGGVCAGADADT